jgi:hypothetical protein
LVAAGIVEGYPDGEYKGQQSMTRYEMAVMVSRALDNISNEMEAMSEGLTTGQAEDVTAIVESLMAKNSNDTLSDGQAEEVADIVDALTFELKAELKVLGADLDALGKDVDALEEKVAMMDVPEDNVEFAVTIDNIFEVASYDVASDDELVATMVLWADGDALDLDMPVGFDGTTIDDVMAGTSSTDYLTQIALIDADNGDWEDGDALPSEKRFWQEFSINMNGDISGAEFSLDLDGTASVFTEENSAFGYDENDDTNFEFDTALLTVEYADTMFHIGEQGDYGVAPYFIDEEDIQGLEVIKNYLDADWSFLVAGFGDDTDDDVYGFSVDKAMDFGTVTGRLYQVRVPGDDYLLGAAEVADIALTDVVTVGGEVVFSDDGTDSDFLAGVNAEFAASDALTVTGMAEVVGEDFYGYANDLKENADYNKFGIGAEYVLNENNTITGDYTLVQPGDTLPVNDEDESTIEVGLENVYGDFTNNASIAYTLNDEYYKDATDRVIELGTEYAWNEKTTLGAALVNVAQEDTNEDNVIKYNYLKGTMSMELSDAMTWDTEAKYIMGEVSPTEISGEGSALTTSLSVSF